MSPVRLNNVPIKALGHLLVSFRRISLRTRCSNLSLSLSLSSPTLVQSPRLLLQLPRLVHNPDPPASICSLCWPVFQSFDLFFLSTSLGINGSGCPPGSAIYTLSSEFLLHSIARLSLIFSDSADKSAVTITFSKYFAQAGPGIAISDNRKNCQMTLGLR